MSTGINDAIRGRQPEEDLLGDLMAKVAAGEGTEEDARLLDDALIFAQAEARRFRNPDAAVRALDRSAIQRNEAGIPTNLGELVMELRRAHPELAKPGPQMDAGAGRQGAPEVGGPSDLTRFIRGR